MAVLMSRPRLWSVDTVGYGFNERHIAEDLARSVPNWKDEEPA